MYRLFLRSRRWELSQQYSSQVLSRAGRDEQATMTTLAGLVVVLFWVVQYIGELFEMIQKLFGL